MHEAFRNAVNPVPRHVCLRLPLKPLTIGHLFLLQELNSPVLSGSPCGFGDILTAVLVCAQPFDEARRMFKRNIWLSVFACYWGFRCRRQSLTDEWKKLFDYLRDEQERPPLSQLPCDQAKQLGAPWEWILLEFLRSTYRMTERQALTTPLRLANVLWATRMDTDGRVNLATATNTVEGIIKRICRKHREVAALNQN